MEDASPARSAISSGILLGFALGLFWSGRSLALRHGPALESERSTVVSAQGNPGMDRAARVIHLPALGVQGEQERCSVEIDVQNLGDEASKLVLVVWGLPVACGPFEAGPYNTACSGLVAPGASWTFEPRQVPLGSYSGRLYSFNARRLSDIGAPVEDRFDDLAADYLCERIFVDTVGDEAEFLAFQRAFERGERFWDLPLDRVLGGEVLAGVQRICPGDLRPGLEVVSSYAGIGGNLLVGSAGIDGRYRQHLSAASVGTSGGTSIVYVQNTGTRCLEPVIDLIDHDDCRRRRSCEAGPISPGESLALDLRACAESGWAGRVEVSAEAPIATTIDRIGQDGLWSRAGSSAGAPPEQEGETVGSLLIAAIPVAESDASSLRTQLSVVAHEAVPEARVRVEVLDADGLPIFFEERELCQGASVHSWTREFEGGGRLEAGQVRVRSLPPILMPAQSGPPISAVIEQERHSGEGPNSLEGAQALRLDAPASAPEDGVALLAIPRMRVDPSRVGSSSEILLSNARLEEGHTDAAIVLFDQNGGVDVICKRLTAGTSLAIGSSQFPMSERGFRGTALVSATAWTHLDAEDRPVVGLAASVIDRDGEGRPADEQSGDRAVALSPSVAASLGLAAYRPECPSDPPAMPYPNRPAAPKRAPLPGASRALLHLPALNQLSDNPDCVARVEVWNEGPVPSLVVAAIQGDFEFCPPECLLPVGVLCSGLLAPGRSWQFEADDALLSARSGRMFSVAALRMDQVGGAADDRRLVADVICSALRDEPDRFGACENQRRIFEAFLGGGRFLDIPFEAVTGPPIRAEVVRDCRPDRRNPLQVGALSVSRASVHAAVGGEALAPDGRYLSAIPWLESDAEGAFSTIHVLNAGTDCASVELRFFDAGEREHFQVQRVLSAPGFSKPVRVEGLKGIFWSGSVEIRSAAALAVSVDRVFEDRIDTGLARPGPLSFDLNEDGREDLADVSAMQALLGSSEGSPGWAPRYDLDDNRRIDEGDLHWLRIHVDPALRPTQEPSPVASPTPGGTPATRTPSPTSAVTASPAAPARIFLPSLSFSTNAAMLLSGAVAVARRTGP